MRSRFLLPSLLLATLAGCGGATGPDLIRVEERAKASEIHAEYLNSSYLNLESLKGKVVVLNFWATWCGPCRMEIPALVALGEKYRSQGLEIVGLSTEMNDGRPREFFSDFIKSSRINYPVGLADMHTLEKYSVSGIPATYFVDRQGRVALSFIGARPEEEFAGPIEKLLKEK